MAKLSSDLIVAVGMGGGSSGEGLVSGRPGRGRNPDPRLCGRVARQNVLIAAQIHCAGRGQKDCPPKDQAFDCVTLLAGQPREEGQQKQRDTDKAKVKRAVLQRGLGKSGMIAERRTKGDGALQTGLLRPGDHRGSKGAKLQSLGQKAWPVDPVSGKPGGGHASLFGQTPAEAGTPGCFQAQLLDLVE